MNLLKFLVTFFLVIMIMAYGLLFTDRGNSIIKPIIELEISDKILLPVKLEIFKLKPEKFDIKLIIDNKASIYFNGSLNFLTQSLELFYDINIDDLSKFKMLVGRKLNGTLKTNGTIKGDKYIIHINGKTNLANSDTFYNIELKDFKPKKIKTTIKHLQIDRLLYTIDQPVYSNGIANIKADINNLDFEKLNGNIITKISNSTLNPEPFKREFNISIPSNITINADINTKLHGTKAISSLNVISSINKLVSEVITYDLKKNSLTADYKLEIPDLDKLYFITNKHMQGDITIIGNIKRAENFMQATAHADTLEGAVDLQLKNEDMNINIKNIQTVALTDMLLYPHIFDSRTNAKIQYNINSRKGTLYAELYEGQILPNKMSFLIKEFTNFDITKEIYERTVLDTKIDKKVLHSNLHMKSRFTEITSKNSIIDLEKETIDTTLDINVKKSIIPVSLIGSLRKPSIKIEGGELIKNRAIKEIEKKLPEVIKNSPLKDLIKNLF